jgi:hypothetical protein
MQAVPIARDGRRAQQFSLSQLYDAVLILSHEKGQYVCVNA